MGSLLSKRGFTLPEVMVSTIILGILAVAVTTVFMACSRTYYVGATDQAAERLAAGALERMVPDLRAAMLVNQGEPPNENSHLLLQMPERVWNADAEAYEYTLAPDSLGNLGLVAGDIVHYYRGNAAGEMTPSGDHIWRMVVHQDGSPGKTFAIASHVVDNPYDSAYAGPKPMFVYWPNEVLRESVEVTITVEVKEGARTSRRTAHSEVALRNL